MSLSKAELIDFLSRSRLAHWPSGFVADKRMYENLFELAGSEQTDGMRMENCLHWLFRLRDYGDPEELFRLFVKMSLNADVHVRSESVWILTGWAAIQGYAGHGFVPCATAGPTFSAVRQSLEMGLNPRAEMRARAFLDHRDVLGVTE